MRSTNVLALILASSVIGGIIGAMATAATESQASPSAIAAAVVKVQDATADRDLTAIKNEIATTNTDLFQLHGTLGQFGTPTIQVLLADICAFEQQQLQATGTFPADSCPLVPIITARDPQRSKR